ARLRARAAARRALGLDGRPRRAMDARAAALLRAVLPRRAPLRARLRARRARGRPRARLAHGARVAGRRGRDALPALRLPRRRQGVVRVERRFAPAPRAEPRLGRHRHARLARPERVARARGRVAAHAAGRELSGVGTRRPRARSRIDRVSFLNTGEAMKHFALRTLPAMLTLVFGQTAWAQAINATGNAANLPVNGTSTSATGAVSGNTLSVNVPDRAVIDWSSFNIGAGYTVNFSGGGGAVLNRVPLSSAANASSINGNLNGSGMTVMLMNPNGIMFGPSAVVNVGALVATTGTIDEDKFRNQNTAAITNATGTVRNQGQITAHSAGLVALVAPSVVNEGTITASGGTIALAGTTAATISMNGGLYEFAVGGTGGEVTNAAGATLSGATLLLSTGDAA